MQHVCHSSLLNSLLICHNCQKNFLKSMKYACSTVFAVLTSSTDNDKVITD